MYKRIIPLLILSTLALWGCSDNDDETILHVQNQSDFTIVDIRVASVDNPSFGPNLLGGDVLLPGEELTLGVQCDTFDARVIDETGAECDLTAVDLCSNNATWVITNDTCPIFTASHQGTKPITPPPVHLNEVPKR